MLADLLTELFAGSSLLDWIVAAMALGWGLIQLGKWARAREERFGRRHSHEASSESISPREALLEARLKAYVTDESRKAKHEAVIEANAETARLSVRLDRAGQKSSDLTDKIQVLANREELIAFARQCEARDAHQMEQLTHQSNEIASLATTIARIEERVKAQDRVIGDMTLGRRRYDRAPGDTD